MRKAESEGYIRPLCHDWRKQSGNSNTPPEALSFSEFFSWLEQHYSQLLKFTTSTSVRYDVEMWFDQEFKLTGRR